MIKFCSTLVTPFLPVFKYWFLFYWPSLYQFRSASRNCLHPRFVWKGWSLPLLWKETQRTSRASSLKKAGFPLWGCGSWKEQEAGAVLQAPFQWKGILLDPETGEVLAEEPFTSHAQSPVSHQQHQSLPDEEWPEELWRHERSFEGQKNSGTMGKRVEVVPREGTLSVQASTIDLFAWQAEKSIQEKTIVSLEHRILEKKPLQEANIKATVGGRNQIILFENVSQTSCWYCGMVKYPIKMELAPFLGKDVPGWSAPIPESGRDWNYPTQGTAVSLPWAWEQSKTDPAKLLEIPGRP